MITTWYLQSHRTWDRSRHSCIGSPSSPWGPSRRASLCRLTIRGTPDRSKLFGSHGQRPWLHDVVSRIVRVYASAGQGRRPFHRDGKQPLGLGDCQLRDVQGQTRHMYLVMLAYSLLMGQLRQGRAKEWALHRLMTIGEACRAMVKEALRTTLAWAIEQVTERNQPYGHVVAQLGLT